MEVIIDHACGMDVHTDSITACIMTPKGKEIRTLPTKTVFLLQLILGMLEDFQVLRMNLYKILL